VTTSTPGLFFAFLIFGRREKNYGLFAEETFVGLGKKRKLFFRKHFLPRFL